MEELLERGVTALEKLAKDEIELQVETKPPVCPHCGKMNPNVRIQISGEGPLAEFFIPAHCLTCNEVFYVFPYQYETLKTLDEVRRFTEEMMSLGGYRLTNGNPGQDQGT